MDVTTKFERYLAYFCSPVLIGIKPANLFTYPMSKWQDITSLLLYWNLQLADYGKHLIPLTVKKNRVLLFVYDKCLLERQLNYPNNIELLNCFCYPSSETVTMKLLYLSERLQKSEDFPHEIGIFLGYPFEDVIGFIKNKGLDFQYSGYWKVYENKQETLKLFQIYTLLREDFYSKLNKGMKITQIISIP